MSKVLNVRETAQYIGRSVNSTLRMLHEGIIPAIRVDNRWMVSVEVIDAWLITESEKQAAIRQTNINI
jgi:excisionase family DNA binding protein